MNLQMKLYHLFCDIDDFCCAANSLTWSAIIALSN